MCACGAPIAERIGKGRPAQFCSERCRVAAHRAKHANNVTDASAQDVTKIKPVSAKRSGGVVTRAPFAYYGGKSYLVPTLLQVLPKHEVYCEVFGGSGVLLFNKKSARLEVFNDLHSGIVNLFRVLRAPESAGELQPPLQLTPYSREEWRECLETWQDEPDPIEKARRWFVVVQQSFSGHDRWAGWRFARKVGRNPAVSYRGAVELLTTFTERLAHVEIEHADFGQVLAAYDGPGTLFFCDPPYLPETRVKGKYQHEMSVDDHIRLLDQLQTLQGKVVLSGYDAPLYQRMLKGWAHLEQSISCHAVGRTRKAGLQGDGAIYAKEQTRIESIWLSPNIARQSTLWQEVV
ncbi:MAG TPA: DNA adenine methylase [Ktedonobacteraceae bacterium]|nr:DNA adenine methylase [Ktedonobacteraceae bacterium]